MDISRRQFATFAAGIGLTAALPLSEARAEPNRPGPWQTRGVIAHDEFTRGLRQWAVELEDGGQVSARHGRLEVDVPAGATLWFRRALQGPYLLEYTATPISAGGANDRVSDLNNFWNAVDVRSPDDIFAVARGGKLAEYNYLRTYYVGYGANGNTTTRLRRYVGDPDQRPLIFDYREPLLTANRPHRVQIASNGSTQQWWVNGRLVFDYADPDPYTAGHFALRTTWSHFAFTDFRIRRLKPPRSR